MAALSPASYTKSGAKSSSPVKLDKAVFGVTPVNHNLLKNAYVSYLANGRDNLAKTKTRGLVSGGGRKPHKQKGTGRARSGSSRNPIWRGGGIVFGPTGEENYTKKLQVTAKRLAVRQALSLAAEGDHIRVIETFDIKDGKVSQAHQLLEKIDGRGQVLLVVETKGDMLLRSTNNLPNVKVVNGRYLNVFDILNSDVLVIEKNSLDQIYAWLKETK